MSNGRIVALVDDDEAVLDSLRLYLSSKGYIVHSYSRARDLLDALVAGTVIECIVSDIRMPGLSGLDLHRELKVRRSRTPIIFVTGHGDIEMAVAAIKAGAHDFLEKPIDEHHLLAIIDDAVSGTDHQRQGERILENFAARVGELSQRQREVMNLAVRGLSNKEIAAQLAISPRTVETYRAWVMERTGTKNLAELVRLSIRLETQEAQSGTGTT